MSATRILLADDDVLLRAAIVHQLKALRPDWTVATATDGHAALLALKVTPFDVLVTDLMMPRFDGIELLMALRSTRIATKIVAMTGGVSFSGNGPTEVARRLGAHDVLEKPFEPETLVRVIETLVGTTSAL